LDVYYATLVARMLAACCEKVVEMPLRIYLTSRVLVEESGTVLLDYSGSIVHISAGLPMRVFRACSSALGSIGVSARWSVRGRWNCTWLRVQAGPVVELAVVYMLSNLHTLQR
jgi:hypothetical protein